MKTLSKIYVGVDVSKKNLDVHLHPVNKKLQVTNDEKGLEKLTVFLKNFDIDQIVCEASGGYELLMMRMLEKKEFKVWRVEPRRIKAFIRSEGVYAKTDACDAKMIALFGAEKTPKHVLIPLSDEALQLKAVVNRRHDLTLMISAEKTRLKQAYDPFCKNLMEQCILFLEKQMEVVDAEILKCINKNNEWKQKAKIAQSMPGIGPVSAALLIAELPELGLVKSKPIAALAGVAPYTRQSGSYRGNAYIGGGRSYLRNILYMAALSAARANPILRKFNERLRNAGKKPKVTIVAVVRKIIVILNAMFRKNAMWKTT